MQEKRYGEFDNFEDFYADLLNDLDESASAGPAKSMSAPAEEIRSPRHEEPALLESIPAKRAPVKRESVRAERPAQKKPVAERKPAAGKTPVRRPKPEELAPEKPQRAHTAVKKADSTVGKAVAFFAVMMIITAIAWCLPLRPTMSVSEKRELDHFPDFSVRISPNAPNIITVPNMMADWIRDSICVIIAHSPFCGRRVCNL